MDQDTYSRSTHSTLFIFHYTLILRAKPSGLADTNFQPLKTFIDYALR